MSKIRIFNNGPEGNGTQIEVDGRLLSGVTEIEVAPIRVGSRNFVTVQLLATELEIDMEGTADVHVTRFTVCPNCHDCQIGESGKP